jgi:hypothetical protein
MKEIRRCIEVMIIMKMYQTKIMPINSFQVVYDDMKTVSFSGDLKANFSDDVTLASAELLVVIQMMCNKKPGIYQRLN